MSSSSIDRRQSVIAAVEALQRAKGRTLRPVRWSPLSAVEETVLALHVADPERPARPETRLVHATKRIVLSLRPRSCITFALGLTAGLAVARSAGGLRESRGKT